MSTLVAGHRESTTPDGVLVQEAAAGSGVSYGELYDRYAEQVYNYCLRVTGSYDDAADATQEAFVNVLRRLQDDDSPVLEFSSYLFAAARNESYALMRRGARVEPSDTLPEQQADRLEVETQPERAAILHDSQAAVRRANATLAPRHREVLALRELGDRSYGEIGQIMGISENSAAQLIWRARSKLREAMTAGAVASVVATSTDCERAQVLLTQIQDDEPVDELDRFWLDRHLDECGSCRSARGMLLEVGAFYCAWVPIAAAAALKSETLTAAGGVLGADWSGVSAGSAGGGGASGGAGGGAAGGGGIGTGGAVAGIATLAAVGIALSAVLQDDDRLQREIANPPQQPAATAPAPDPAASAAKTSQGERDRVSPEASGLSAAGAPLRAPRRDVGSEREAPSANPPSGAPPSTQVPRKPRSPEPRRNAPEPNSPGQQAPDGGPPVDAPRGGPPGDPASKPPPDPREPPVDTTPPPGPPPPSQQGCMWPGGGNGPGGCPPGHGGTPPGHGGTSPGQAGKPERGRP